MAQIGYKGEELDLLVKQGATFRSGKAQLLNPDNSPVNLTGCTIQGQIRKQAKSSNPAATFDVAVTNATSGEYEFNLSAAVTATIKAGETMEEEASMYVWDLELVDTLGEITPIFYGAVTVFREVTRVGS